MSALQRGDEEREGLSYSLLLSVRQRIGQYLFLKKFNSLPHPKVLVTKYIHIASKLFL
jgi:hypothetical protein